MSISDMIVVMKDGILQQIGAPQTVYDDPTNLFVAKFLGTPPVGVYDAWVKGGKLCIGDEAVLDVPGVPDGELTAAIRPEGYVLTENGALTAKLLNVEVMGRDISIVSVHPATGNTPVRSIISAENLAQIKGDTVRFDLKRAKVYLFDKSTEERIRFDVK